MGHLILYEVNNILILILQRRKRVLKRILELAQITQLVNGVARI